MSGQTIPGLTQARVQPDVTDQLPGAVEPVDSADGGHHPHRNRDIHPGNRQQALDFGIVEGILGDLTIQGREILAEAIQFSQVPFDRTLLIFRDWLLANQARPRPPKRSECGDRGIRCACRIVCTSFLIRVRCRTTCTRRATRRRARSTSGDGVQIVGRKPAAWSEASVAASTLSVFTWA